MCLEEVNEGKRFGSVKVEELEGDVTEADAKDDLEEEVTVTKRISQQVMVVTQARTRSEKARPLLDQGLFFVNIFL